MRWNTVTVFCLLIIASIAVESDFTQSNHECVHSQVIRKIWKIISDHFKEKETDSEQAIRSMIETLRKLQNFIISSPATFQSIKLIKDVQNLENEMIKNLRRPEINMYSRLGHYERQSEKCKNAMLKLLQSTHQAYEQLLRDPMCRGVLQRYENPTSLLNFHQKLVSPIIDNELYKNHIINKNKFLDVNNKMNEPNKDKEFMVNLLHAKDVLKEFVESHKMVKEFPRIRNSKYGNDKYSFINNDTFLIHSLQKRNNVRKENNANPEPKAVELTYLVQKPNPVIYRPFYYITYQIPYKLFKQTKKANRANGDDILVGQDVLYQANITGLSPDLKEYDKDEIIQITSDHGKLVHSKVLDIRNNPVLENFLRMSLSLNSNKDILKNIRNNTNVRHFTSLSENKSNQTEKKIFHNSIIKPQNMKKSIFKSHKSFKTNLKGQSNKNDNNKAVDLNISNVDGLMELNTINGYNGLPWIKGLTNLNVPKKLKNNHKLNAVKPNKSISINEVNSLNEIDMVNGYYGLNWLLSQIQNLPK